jgi:hypothetical protein
MSAAEWLPQCDVREYHERIVDVPPERALQVTLETPVAPDSIVRTLFWLRGFGSHHGRIGEFFSRGGFMTLAHTPTTYVFGLAARPGGHPSRAADVAAWQGWAAPGIKIAADFQALPAGDGRTRLTTETRVLSLDTRSRRLFGWYWLIVGPFSAWIRRRWLRAIAARCGSGALPLSLGFPPER